MKEIGFLIISQNTEKQKISMRNTSPYCSFVPFGKVCIECLFTDITFHPLYQSNEGTRTQSPQFCRVLIFQKKAVSSLASFFVPRVFTKAKD